jgi:hypothetical protein
VNAFSYGMLLTGLNRRPAPVGENSGPPSELRKTRVAHEKRRTHPLEEQWIGYYLKLEPPLDFNKARDSIRGSIA